MLGGETAAAIRWRKGLLWRHREEQRKLDVKNISENLVKNAFYLLWIRVL